MDIFLKMEDDVMFVAQGGGVLSVECCTGILQAFEEYGMIPGTVRSSSGGTLFSSLYYSGHDTAWFRELMVTRKLSEFFQFCPVGVIGSVTGCRRHLVDNDGVKKLLEDEMTGEATKRVLTSVVRLRDWTSLMVPATPGYALAATSIPWIFSPVEVFGELYGDGGVKNNIPVPPKKDLRKYKHVYVFLTPPTQYNDTTNDNLIVGLLELLQAVMDREYTVLKKQRYFEHKKITVIQPEDALGGGLLNWSKDFALREHCYQLTKEILKDA